MKGHPPNGRDDGVALVAVLWLVTLLTLVATAAVAIASSRVRVAKTAVEVSQSVLTLDSAIRLALVGLASRRPLLPAEASADSTVTVFGEPVDVRIELERNHTNLNTAGVEELTATFMAAKWSERDAQTAAARIEDWRDADDNPQRGGAELPQYRASGLAYGPRNGPFESVDELAQVLGVPSLTDELRESLTVYGRAKRDAVPEASGAESPVAAAAQSGELLRIRACRADGQPQVCRRAVLRVTGARERSLQVFEWITTSE